MPQRPLPWRTASSGPAVSYLLAAAILVAAIVVLGEELRHHIASFEGWLDALGPLALPAFAVLYALLSSAFIPDTLLGIVAGVSFGTGRGILVALGGSLLAGVLQKALAQRALRPAIDRFVGARPAAAAIRSAVHKQQLRVQLLLRLAPINRAMIGYLLGASGVGWTGFLLAYVAVVPHLVVEVYFGVAGKHLARSAGQPGHSVLLHDGAMLGGLLAALLVMRLVSRWARGAIQEAAETLSSTPTASHPGLE